MFRFRSRAVAGAVGRVCALSAVTLAASAGGAAAHAGHEHAGDDGRFPGQPDVMRVGREVHRYDADAGLYRVEEGGRAAGTYHVDSQVDSGSAHQLPAQEDAPVCATSGHRIVVVWHRPASGYTANAPALIRNVVRRMNWKIKSEAERSSGGRRTLDMVVECDSSGQIAVREQVSDTNARFVDIENEVQTTFGTPSDASSVKYLVFRDGPATTAAGTARMRNHDTKSASDTVLVNQNRTVTSTAVTWREYWEKQTPIHELTHAMGGSQPGAPYATPGNHCIDGLDILCYQDASVGEPPVPYVETFCPAPTFYTPENVPLDCNYDTYFDALPEAGEWLQSHWNVGGNENPFLVSPKKSSSFNGDRYAELIIADSVTNSYAVALNDGAGRLGIYGSGPWEGGWGARPVWAGVGDFNGDGKTDLIASDDVNNAYAVSVSTGSALGGPGTQQWLTGWDGGPNWGGVGDFNGDGLDDLVIADEVNNAYAVAISTGSRLTGPGTGLWLTGYGSRPDFAGVGDFNGDGLDDLLIVEAANLRYRVLLSDGTRFGAAGSGIWQTGWGRPTWGGIGDFNGDGKDDLIVSSGTSHTYAVSVSTGSALGGPGTQQWLSGWDGAPNLAGVGDFNGDGKDDLIVSDDDNGRYGVAVSDGSRLNGSGFWLTGWNSAPAWGAVSR